jgi:hypothetical protein
LLSQSALFERLKQGNSHFMLAAFIICTFGSIGISILSSSILWKFGKVFWHGYIPVLSMIPAGILMLLIFDLWQPTFLTINNYVLILYSLCFLFFIIQLMVVLQITKKARKEAQSRKTK